eukprot:TRINITY_DN4345_c0_g1_i1.p2 TRINITY_DN4345_c0_g1~~TRINITY_DN4345_c0_g1_i1.p2  ORF type:complete len:179 (+),score=2.81 TRINITY_DN4345_c0_g1_i1:547-1083(+)
MYQWPIPHPKGHHHNKHPPFCSCLLFVYDIFHKQNPSCEYKQQKLNILLASKHIPTTTNQIIMQSNNSSKKLQRKKIITTRKFTTSISRSFRRLCNIGASKRVQLKNQTELYFIIAESLQHIKYAVGICAKRKEQGKTLKQLLRGLSELNLKINIFAKIKHHLQILKNLKTILYVINL